MDRISGFVLCVCERVYMCVCMCLYAEGGVGKRYMVLFFQSHETAGFE